MGRMRPSMPAAGSVVGDAFGVGGPPIGDGLAAFGGEVELAARDGGVGEVDDGDAVPAGGGGDGPGVGADGLAATAPGRHGRAGVGEEHPDAAGLRGLAGEVGGHAEVVAVADRDTGDAVSLGTLDADGGGPLGEDLPDAVVAVEDDDRTGVADHLRVGRQPPSHRYAAARRTRAGEACRGTSGPTARPARGCRTPGSASSADTPCWRSTPVPNARRSSASITRGVIPSPPARRSRRR